MTARLGSEYRYFGKLVLVPFRYFSIDTYRNIDIFDNTSIYDCLILNKLSMYHSEQVTILMTECYRHRSGSD